jgi:serine/threonine protein kinase
VTHDKAKSIFLDLLEIPDSDHEQYIDRVCSDDVALRRRVVSLIRAHQTADQFLGGVEGTDTNEVLAESALPMPDSIGPYRVIEKLGDGGFGSVYLCEQTEPISRRVAVKVLHQQFNSPTAPQRFEEERILLARMEHPGIARVLDAGKTETGHPFIAMEHIDGSSITSYCDKHKLSIDERVELCIQACRAVQHAHQKGVIHRDIKPSNILVHEVDSNPRVKVIDFGVSKAFVDELQPDQTITHSMQLVGTPQYMSPEQASTGTQSLDTRSDVYALGVLLYELICGHQPFDAQQLRSASASQLEKLIRETDPVRPSNRLAQSPTTDGQQIAFNRSQLRPGLIQTLKGEFDWITMRAMEKDPDRRYPTANALGDDLGRALNNQAVEAGPPSKVYKAKRFIARHRVPVALGSMLALSLVAVTLVSIITSLRLQEANERITNALERREEVILFTEDMLSGIDPAEARGRDTALFEEILQQASERLERGFTEDPSVDVRLRVMVGSMYRTIGSYDEARDFLEQAERRAAKDLGDQHPQTIQARSSLGSVYAELSLYDQAREMLELAVRNAKDIHGLHHKETLSAKSNLGATLNALGLLNESITIQREVLEGRVTLLGDLHEDTMATRNNLANALNRNGETDEPRQLFERVLAHQLDALGDDHPNTLRTRTNLALLYSQLEMEDRAAAMNEDVLATKRRVLGDRHPSVLVSMVNLASNYEKAKRYDDSRQLLESALAISLEDMGEVHQYTLTIRNNYAGLLSRVGDLDIAIDHQRQACDGLVALIKESHPTTIQSHANLARMLLDAELYHDVIDVVQVQIPIATEHLGEASHTLHTLMELKSQAQLASGDHAAARATVEELGALIQTHRSDDTEKLTEIDELRNEIYNAS